MALVLFAVTLFVSAFILFLVQPIIGKTILPKLGGTPQVWNTCMVFFQAVLLLGYFYTHASSTRLSLRRQLIIHCVLLFIPFLFLLTANGPFDITNWIPPLGANPLTATLVLLFAVVGVPFFVVSTSAPLLQKWFGSTGHPAAQDPYFLYGASNLGSMLALVLYPILIEPFMDLTPQKWMWTVGYGVLVLMVLACAAMIWKPAGLMKVRYAGGPPVEPSSEGQPVPPPVLEGGPPVNTGITTALPPPAPPITVARSTAFKKGKPQFRPPGMQAPTESVVLKAPSDEMTTWRRLRWIGLAFVPSSLMLGVTTHITTDLSPIPLFWLIPLTIYLLSFILVFSKWPVTWVEAPHTYMLYIQPALICLMIFIDILGAHMTSMWGPIAANVIAFGATALVCHGELAKDRPGTRHLTEFYLLMSVGGVLGGIFNGIIAPVVFIYVWEFGIAVICACFLRPIMKDGGWADDLVSGIVEQPAAPAVAPGHKRPKDQHVPRSIARVGASASTTRVMDFALPVAVLALMFVFYMIVGIPTGAEGEERVGLKYFLIYGIPLTIAAFYYGRPVRFGLAVMAIMIFHQVLSSRGDASVYADRSYFGILRVKTGHEIKGDANVFFTQLIHGHINHGMNIFKPDNKADWGNKDKDFSRLATTYYHRYGPAGIVMEKFNWFPGSQNTQNTYWGDSRMPATLVGQAAVPLGIGILPIGQLVDLWSEPPFATIGLGTGTMASYGRPYQHVHYYEIDDHVRRLSLPLTRKDQYYFTYESIPQEIPFTNIDFRRNESDFRRSDKFLTCFNSLKDATHRGCEVEILMGDARLRMDLPYKNMHVDHLLGGGPESFYHMMVVDAFSSDAIPVHLITKEALVMYFKHLTEEGILCVHTSNRYVDLPLVVAAVASDLGFAYRRGHDQAPNKELGRFTSEWVMVARKDEYLNGLKDPPNYASQLREGDPKRDPDDPRNFYWTTPIPNRKYLWTDDHSNLWNVIR